MRSNGRRRRGSPLGQPGSRACTYILAGGKRSQSALHSGLAHNHSDFQGGAIASSPGPRPTTVVVSRPYTGLATLFLWTPRPSSESPVLGTTPTAPRPGGLISIDRIDMRPPPPCVPTADDAAAARWASRAAGPSGRFKLRVLAPDLPCCQLPHWQSVSRDQESVSRDCSL
jgi:hypothetical protein